MWPWFGLGRGVGSLGSVFCLGDVSVSWHCEGWRNPQPRNQRWTETSRGQKPEVDRNRAKDPTSTSFVFGATNHNNQKSHADCCTENPPLMKQWITRSKTKCQSTCGMESYSNAVNSNVHVSQKPWPKGMQLVAPINEAMHQNRHHQMPPRLLKKCNLTDQSKTNCCKECCSGPRSNYQDSCNLMS